MSATQPDASFYRRPEVFGAGPALINHLGQPVPPTEVVERLRLIDERLSIEWVEGAWGAAYFGLFERWRQGDRRWERVQNGELPESKARDLVRMFPRECPAPEMAAFVEQRWGGRAILDPVKEAQKAVDRAQASLEKAKESAINAVVSKSMDKFDSETAHDRRLVSGADSAHPMVPGVGAGTMHEPKRLIEVP